MNGRDKNWSDKEESILKSFCEESQKKEHAQFIEAGKGLAHKAQVLLREKGFERTINAINGRAKKFGGFTAKSRHGWTDKAVKILKKYKRYGDGGILKAKKELAKNGIKKTYSAVQMCALKLNLNIKNLWTDEERNWLKERDNYDGPLEEVVDLFLEEFPNCNRTRAAIESEWWKLGCNLNLLWREAEEKELQKIKEENKKLSVEEIQKRLEAAYKEFLIEQIEKQSKEGDLQRSLHSIINKCYSKKIDFKVDHEWEYWTEEEMETLLDESLTTKEIQEALKHRTPAAVIRKRLQLKNPLFKLITKSRGKINGAIKNYIKNPRSYKDKDSQATQLLECQIDFYVNEYLLKHEDFQKEHWRLDNHGEVWHIDHILQLHKAENEEELLKRFNYKNTRPMWATTEQAQLRGVMNAVGNLNRGLK